MWKEGVLRGSEAAEKQCEVFSLTSVGLGACSSWCMEDYVRYSYPTTNTHHVHVPSSHRFPLLHVTLAVNQFLVALHLIHHCLKYSSFCKRLRHEMRSCQHGVLSAVLI